MALRPICRRVGVGDLITCSNEGLDSAKVVAVRRTPSGALRLEIENAVAAGLLAGIYGWMMHDCCRVLRKVPDTVPLPNQEAISAERSSTRRITRSEEDVLF